MVLKDSSKWYKVGFLVVAISLFTFVFTWNTCESVSAITVYPTESNEILKNPNKGFMVSGNATTKIITDSRFTPEVWSNASIAYLRCDWSTLEPNDNQYDWSHIDNALIVSVNRGCKLAVAVMPACVFNETVNTQATPNFVFSAGAAYTTEYGRKIPVWNDPVYISEFQEFITALKNRYDTNDNIAFFDIRNYGNYGEWHLGNLPNSAPINDTEKKAHVDMWSAFTKTLMLINNTSPLDVVGIYARDTYKTGIRRDGCVDPNYPTMHMTLSYAYDKTPATGEWYRPYTELKSLNRWDPVMFERTLKEGMPSYMGLSIWDENDFYSEQSTLISRWVNRVGYWLKIVKAQYDSLGNGVPATFYFQVKNDGVAPIYPNKNNIGYVKQYTLSGVNPYLWKPGKYAYVSSGFQFGYHANAAKLAVGVFTKDTLTNPDVKWGISGKDANSNWYVLNSMPTTEPNEISANKLYSASAEWESTIGYREARYAFDNDPNTSWVGDNLLVNPGFEYPVANGLYNYTNWQANGSCSITTVTDQKKSGSYAAKIYSRLDQWTGMRKDITSKLKDTGVGQYYFGGYMRATSGTPSMKVIIKLNDDAGDKYFVTNATTINSTGWTNVSATQNITWQGNLNSATFIIQSADTNNQDIYVDDCNLISTDGHWLEVNFGEMKTFSKAFIQEKNARTTSFKIKYYNGTDWVDASTGGTIGTAGIDVSFSSVTGNKVRLQITGSSGWPDIAEFKILK